MAGSCLSPMVPDSAELAAARWCVPPPLNDLAAWSTSTVVMLAVVLWQFPGLVWIPETRSLPQMP